MYWDEDWAFSEYDAGSFNIWEELRELTHLWTTAYRSYWGFDAAEPPPHLAREDWEHFRQYAKIGPVILEIARTLTLHAPAADRLNDPFVHITKHHRRFLRDLLRDLAKGPPIEDQIGLDLADQATEQLKGSTRRAIRLISLARERTLSDRAASFVTRATTPTCGASNPSAR